MSSDDLGLWIFAAATTVCVIVATVLVHLYPVKWFRERLLSEDRWTRASGMLPIAFPVYLCAGLLFSLLRH